MMSVVSKWKIWLIAVLVIIVAGMTIFGVIGNNQSIQYKEHYELSVSVKDIKDTDKKVFKDAVDKYLGDNDLHDVKYAFSTEEDGGKLFYVFTDDVSNHVEGVKNAVKAAIPSGYNVETECLVVSPIYTQPNLNIIYVAVIFAVVSFIYLLFLEKIVAALTSLCTSVIGGLLFISLASIIRVPANPYLIYVTAGVFALSSAISSIFSHMAKDKFEKSAEKLSYSQVADNIANKNLIANVFMNAGFIVAAVAFISVGSMQLKFLGIQLVLASLVITFIGLFISPCIWTLLNNKIRPKKVKASKSQEENI